MHNDVLVTQHAHKEEHGPEEYDFGGSRHHKAERKKSTGPQSTQRNSRLGGGFGGTSSALANGSTDLTILKCFLYRFVDETTSRRHP